MTSWAIIWHNSKTTTMRLVDEKEHVWCYVRHIDWTTSIFSKTWLCYSMGPGDLSSQVHSGKNSLNRTWLEGSDFRRISQKWKSPNSRLKCTEVLAKPFPTRRAHLKFPIQERRRIGNGRTQATYHTPFAYGVDSRCPISVPLLAKPHKESSKSIQNFRKSPL